MPETRLDLSSLAATIADRVLRKLERKDARMRTWIFQDPRMVAKHGEAHAAWYVGWRTPEEKRKSKSCGPGLAGKRLAKREAERINALLVIGSYESNEGKTWAEFRKQYETTVTPTKSAATQEQIERALNCFERIAQPGKVAAITTGTIDAFIVHRLREKSIRYKRTISPATVNKELRHIQAALQKAGKWKYTKEVPDVTMQREIERLPNYVRPEHFEALYMACESMKMPQLSGISPGQWWRALLVMAYMTGWRIGELLSIDRTDLDLNAGTALTRGDKNKGKRDALIDLHDVVVSHLRQLSGFSEKIFHWPYHRRYLDACRLKLCALAGVPAYGFHDLRRAFASENADRVKAAVLQRLMRHSSFATTLKYVNLANKLKKAVGELAVPSFLCPAKENEIRRAAPD